MSARSNDLFTVDEDIPHTESIRINSWFIRRQILAHVNLARTHLLRIEDDQVRSPTRLQQAAFPQAKELCRDLGQLVNGFFQTNHIKFTPTTPKHLR